MLTAATPSTAPEIGTTGSAGELVGISAAIGTTVLGATGSLGKASVCVSTSRWALTSIEVEEPLDQDPPAIGRSRGTKVCAPAEPTAARSATPTRTLFMPKRIIPSLTTFLCSRGYHFYLE